MAAPAVPRILRAVAELTKARLAVAVLGGFDDGLSVGSGSAAHRHERAADSGMSVHSNYGVPRGTPWGPRPICRYMALTPGRAMTVVAR
jgi:hypothetical protein